MDKDLIIHFFVSLIMIICIYFGFVFTPVILDSFGDSDGDEAYQYYCSIRNKCQCTIDNDEYCRNGSLCVIISLYSGFKVGDL